MKTIIKHIAYGALLGAPLFLGACSDTWGDHYDAETSAMASDQTLWETMQANPRLTNFCRVLSTIQADKTFASPQQLTVWAPLDMTSQQADSVISLYNEDVAQGLKLEDNRATTQFLRNHVALYARNISSLTADTVSMLNGKYMKLTGTAANRGALAKMDGTEANAILDKTVAANGILYQTEHIQQFFPNVRELVEQRPDMDSLAALIRQFDKYDLDEKASVAGGIVDGKTIYLDSVTNLSNSLLMSYGYIQREDSVYTLIAPTDEVWRQEYETYSKYYRYDNSVMNADSLQESNTRLRILEGRVFNTSTGSRFNLSTDSLCNTQYREIQQHYPRKNVYYDPYGSDGILSGLTRMECSNGYVYADPRGVIDPRTTFFDRQDIDASSGRYYVVPINKTTNEPTMNVSYMTYETYKDSAKTELDQKFPYSLVTSKVASAQTELEYNIPNVLSGCFYNIYLVTVPAPNRLPTWMVFQHQEKNEKGVFPNYKYFENPHRVTADSDIPSADVLLKQSNSQRIFFTDPDRVDTILVQSAVEFPYSGYGLNDAVVHFKINSVGPSSAAQREKIYSRTLRLNEIILVPFATKEEAEDAADRIDAFNDKILEANKKY